MQIQTAETFMEARRTSAKVVRDIQIPKIFFLS